MNSDSASADTPPGSSGDTDPYDAIADLYDHVGPYRERPDIGFFVAAAKVSGGPVLELGCGTGRVLIPTARHLIEIVGLDSSARMLAVCGEHVRAEPEAVRAQITLVRGDMRAFNLERSFSLITLPFRPFQHLITIEEQFACLAGIHQHLRNDGRLILDLFNPSLEALTSRPLGTEAEDTPEFAMPDGRRVTRRFRVTAHDRAAQVNHVELIYYVTHPGGREERLVHAFPMRYLFRFEAEHLLARAGFAIEHLHGGYDKSAFGSAYPGELIFVARKASPASHAH